MRKSYRFALFEGLNANNSASRLLNRPLGNVVGGDKSPREKSGNELPHSKDASHPI
jgi:hypothetical protein